MASLRVTVGSNNELYVYAGDDDEELVAVYANDEAGRARAMAHVESLAVDMETCSWCTEEVPDDTLTDQPDGSRICTECLATDEASRPEVPNLHDACGTGDEITTCGICAGVWCSYCDPAPSALCPWCHGLGWSTAALARPRYHQANHLPNNNGHPIQNEEDGI